MSIKNRRFGSGSGAFFALPSIWRAVNRLPFHPALTQGVAVQHSGERIALEKSLLDAGWGFQLQLGLVLALPSRGNPNLEHKSC